MKRGIWQVLKGWIGSGFETGLTMDWREEAKVRRDVDGEAEAEAALSVRDGRKRNGGTG